MKNSENENVKIFNGAGYLIGFMFSAVAAICVFVFSNNFVVSLLSAFPTGITLGIVLEQKFQKEEIPVSPLFKKIMFGLLILGIIVFFSVLLFANQL